MAQQEGDEWCRLWSNRLSTPLTKIADGCGLSSDRAESSTRWNRIIDQPADKDGFTLAGRPCVSNKWRRRKHEHDKKTARRAATR